jgi:hypothetical protein
LKSIDLETLVYLAGYFDGEGCVSGFETKAISVTVGSADEEIIKLFHEYFGGCLSHPKPTSKTKRAILRWSIAGNPAQEFLIYVLPWLRSKRDVALWALGPTYRKSNKPLTEEEIAIRSRAALEIKKVNQRVTVCLTPALP